MIKALIFDFDGLILDTEVPAFEAWKEIYRAYGFDLELSTWVSCIGTSGGFDPYGDLRRRVGRTINIEAISEKRRALSAPRVERQPLLPGVEARIIEAKRLGLKLGVASNSSDAWVTGHLGRLGLEHHFDAFSFGNWVARSKPDPEIYEAILNKLEIRGDQSGTCPRGLAKRYSFGQEGWPLLRCRPKPAHEMAGPERGRLEVELFGGPLSRRDPGEAPKTCHSPQDRPSQKPKFYLTAVPKTRCRGPGNGSSRNRDGGEAASRFSGYEEAPFIARGERET